MQELGLVRCNLDCLSGLSEHQPLIKVLSWLETAPSLQHLDLQVNSMPTTVFSYIAKAAAKGPKLRRVDLSYETKCGTPARDKEDTAMDAAQRHFQGLHLIEKQNVDVVD
jgi:hypothetical protein